MLIKYNVLAVLNLQICSAENLICARANGTKPLLQQTLHSCSSSPVLNLKGKFVIWDLRPHFLVF